MTHAASNRAREVVFDNRDGSLLDLVDNLLNQGVVLSGELTLSLADVDLVYCRLSVLLCAADFLLPLRKKPPNPGPRVRQDAPRRLARG